MTGATTSYAFWDRIAERYSKSPIADEEAYQKKLEVTREYFRPDMQVLEFGCGTGSTALLHAPHVRHIRAIDVSRNMIQIAQGKAEAQGVGNVTFEQARIEDLAIPPQSVDMVLGMSILHLLPNKEEVIAKVYDMLAPGGLFVSSTACLGGGLKNAPLRLILPLGRWIGRLPLVKFFTADHLEQRLTAAGFTIEYRWQPGKNRAVFFVAQKPPADG